MSLYVPILGALLAGFILGYVARPFLGNNAFLKPVEPEQLSRFMTRIVNAEGAEERRNQLRKMLHDSGRRTMRTDGGQPAKVHKMRKIKRVYRNPG